MRRKTLLFSLSLLLLSILLTVFSVGALAAPVTPHGTARFETPNATINISNNRNSYKTIWMNAIRAWNNTGAFNFSLSKDPNAQVIANSETNLPNRDSGITQLTISNQGIILQATSTLNTKVLANAGYLPSQETNVAEHELGHAIGLYHNPDKQSVMYAANRYYGIQPVDVAGVRDLYASPLETTPSTSQDVSFHDPLDPTTLYHKIQWDQSLT
ncbi:matrixin family metalloprotease [Lentilactobacillus raoultii]|uniref:Matrixin family metalloprotease n=1 Tax=Lentilactobacillus raoultii TaxID=1987503 RepID=A0ABW3PJX6_9LACO|nr:matrixin family metalloprotease [Lentilactobacillus raoultii]